MNVVGALRELLDVRRHVAGICHPWQMIFGGMHMNVKA